MSLGLSHGHWPERGSAVSSYGQRRRYGTLGCCHIVHFVDPALPRTREMLIGDDDMMAVEKTLTFWGFAQNGWKPLDVNR